MKKLLFSFLLVLFLSQNLISQPSNPRTAAEWEEMQGVLISWSWADGFKEVLLEIVKQAKKECTVYILCESQDYRSLGMYLSANGVWDSEKVKLIAKGHGVKSSVWVRDYGPISVYSNAVLNLFFIDWIYQRQEFPFDNVVPEYIVNYEYPSGNRFFPDITNFDETGLVNDGGNFMTDGKGIAYATRDIITINGNTSSWIKNKMKIYNGIAYATNRIFENYQPPNNLVHIDMFMKLLDEETLLVGQYEDSDNSSLVDEFVFEFTDKSYYTCYPDRRRYKIVWIPMPEPDGTGKPRTYTNSLILNKTVLVPVYGGAYSSKDAAACSIYANAMPGYNIVPINCEDVISDRGAIHCMTMGIAVNDPIFISHASLREDDITENGLKINAKIELEGGLDLDGNDNVKIYWSRRPDTYINSTDMVRIPLQDDEYKGEIIDQDLDPGHVVYYKISVTKGSRTVSKPYGGYYKFTVPAGFPKSGVKDLFVTPENAKYTLANNYPNPFNPETTIKYSLSEEANVSLRVYDLLGKEVAVLVNEWQSSGDHEAVFNAGDLPSGVYIYRLLSGTFEQTKKMLLVK